MKVLVVGASGATGRKLVQQLLNRNHAVKVIVRSPEKLPDTWREHPKLEIITAGIAQMSTEEMVQAVKGCDAVASCLGHNLTLKGILGPPRKLVTDATRNLCEAIRATEPEKPIKFVLMNTTGNRNRDLDEPISLAQKLVMALIRLLVPPQSDNEKAADYLRTQIGQHHAQIDWIAVRPDGLLDEEAVSQYDVFPSPVRSAVFNPGQTSRINVGHFMADLISDEELWKEWQGQMPVIYNSASLV